MKKKESQLYMMFDNNNQPTKSWPVTLGKWNQRQLELEWWKEAHGEGKQQLANQSTQHHASEHDGGGVRARSRASAHWWPLLHRIPIEPKVTCGMWCQYHMIQFVGLFVFAPEMNISATEVLMHFFLLNQSYGYYQAHHMSGRPMISWATPFKKSK